MSETEARLLANPELVKQIEQSVADTSRRVRRGRPRRQEE
jgi:hypothetical protein